MRNMGVISSIILEGFLKLKSDTSYGSVERKLTCKSQFVVFLPCFCEESVI